jgi:hypothetical protein
MASKTIFARLYISSNFTVSAMQSSISTCVPPVKCQRVCYEPCSRNVLPLAFAPNADPNPRLSTSQASLHCRNSCLACHICFRMEARAAPTSLWCFERTQHWINWTAILCKSRRACSRLISASAACSSSFHLSNKLSKLNSARGLERDRDGGEVRAMTHTRHVVFSLGVTCA